MSTWIIEPRDPLIVRDGRPFGPDPGVRAASLPFPFPSTTTGAVRHKAGLHPGGDFDRSRIEEVMRLSVRGPLLVELDDSSDAITHWYAPAPADALVLDAQQPSEGALDIRRLVPLELPEGTAMNLDGGLLPVGQPQRLPSKPSRSAPRFWRWKKFEHWLCDPQNMNAPPSEVGISGLEIDWRMHVSIQPGQQTAVEGALFQTGGLVFTWRDPEAQRVGRLQTRRLALAVASEGVFPHFSGGIAPIGGERRLAAWRRTDQPLPACPAGLARAVAEERACRVILLTPALFRAGALPEELLQPEAGVTPTLFAAAVPRAQVVSGWDLKAHKPKPTRRLAPAGAVYFIRFGERDDPAAIESWVEQRWMTCVSDAAQDRADGFGLAVLGVGPRAGATMEESDGTS